MRKLTALVAVILMFGGAATALAHYPGKIVLDTAKAKQPGVPFDHAKHGDKLAKNCGTCHHTQKDLTKEHTNTTDVKKCSTCHLSAARGKVGTIREASLTKNPYHVNCIGCHKEQKKGPTVCTGCHKKA